MKTSDTTKEAGIVSYAASIVVGRVPAPGLPLAARVREGCERQTPALTLNDGVWHHLVVTWKSTGGLIRVYKDGVLAYTNPIPVQDGASITTGGTLVLGQEQDSVGGGFDPSQAFLGKLDEFALYPSVAERRAGARRTATPASRSGAGSDVRRLAAKPRGRGRAIARRRGPALRRGRRSSCRRLAPRRVAPVPDHGGDRRAPARVLPAGSRSRPGVGGQGAPSVGTGTPARARRAPRIPPTSPNTAAKSSWPNSWPAVNTGSDPLKRPCDSLRTDPDEDPQRDPEHERADAREQPVRHRGVRRLRCPATAPATTYAREQRDARRGAPSRCRRSRRTRWSRTRPQRGQRHDDAGARRTRPARRLADRSSTRRSACHAGSGAGSSPRASSATGDPEPVAQQRAERAAAAGR